MGLSHTGFVTYKIYNIKPLWLCLILLIVTILSYFSDKINYCVKNKATLIGHTIGLNTIIYAKQFDYQCLTSVYLARIVNVMTL